MLQSGVAEWTVVPALLMTYELVVSVALAVVVLMLVVHRLVGKYRSKPHPHEGSTGPRPAPNHRDQWSEQSSHALTPELLTDEDRVIRMLESSGGRIRQMAIVEQTDWSKSKVSRLLTAMEEQGMIEKISVGRENVIELRQQTE